MKLSKQDRLAKSCTRDGLDELADEKERNARTRGELTRLTQFMNRGGRLVEEVVPGIGVIFRSMARTCAPFSAEAVARYRERAAKAEAKRLSREV